MLGFTTALAPNATADDTFCLHLELFDSWADGWYESGVVVLMYGRFGKGGLRGITLPYDIFRETSMVKRYDLNCL